MYRNSKHLLSAEFWHTTAFIWTPEQGMLEVRVVLKSLGIDTDGWQLITAWDVSDDGSTVVGVGFNPMGQFEGWVAVIPEPSTTLQIGIGLVGLALSQGIATRREGNSFPT